MWESTRKTGTAFTMTIIPINSFLVFYVPGFVTITFVSVLLSPLLFAAGGFCRDPYFTHKLIEDE